MNFRTPGKNALNQFAPAYAGSLAGLLFFLCLLLDPKVASAREEGCWICGKPIIGTVYLLKDEVAGVKREICTVCAVLPDECYLCSLPVKNGTDLKDGRHLCERDAKGVILDEVKIKGVCEAVAVTLDRQFSRHLTFPSNVVYHVADRLTLVDLFVVVGKDYTCPNVLGFTSQETNGQQAEFSISILSGQTQAAIEAVCAHELAHTWLMANVTAERRKALNRDSVEGFCELIGYMLMREKGESAQIAMIRTNLYTRGQIDLFIDAEQRFGFADVLDWMKQGEADRLRADEIWRIRELKVVKPANPPAPVVLTASVPPPEPARDSHLMLKRISLGKTPLALINHCTLTVGETGRVKLAGTNVVIRCTAIRADSVVIEMVGSGETQELRFEAKAKK